MPQCAHNPLWLLLQADPATRIVPSQPSPQLSLRTRGLRNSRTGKRLRAGPGETWRVPPLAWKIALCLARLPITSPASSPRYSDREYPSLPVSLPAFRAVMVPGRAARRLDAVASARSEQLGRGFLQGWGFRRVLVVGEALVDLPRGLVEAPRKARAGEGPGDLRRGRPREVDPGRAARARGRADDASVHEAGPGRLHDATDLPRRVRRHRVGVHVEPAEPEGGDGARQRERAVRRHDGEDHAAG